MAKGQIIINRQKAVFNSKHRHLPEELMLSIYSGGGVEYAFAIEVTGTWILKQDSENSRVPVPTFGSKVTERTLRLHIDL